MSLPMGIRWSMRGSFPRVSGDEPAGFGVESTRLVFSPRERG